jgi:hypothetical protein
VCGAGRGVQVRSRFDELSRLQEVSLGQADEVNEEELADFAETGAESDGDEEEDDIERPPQRGEDSFGVRVQSRKGGRAAAEPDQTTAAGGHLAVPIRQVSHDDKAHGNYRLDYLRQDDRQRMNAMIKSLQAQRPQAR